MKKVAKRVPPRMPAKLEVVDVSTVEPYPENVRVHDEDNLEAIRNSLQEFGQTKPVLVWQGYIIAGNGTFAAIKSLGWSQVAIVRRDDLTDHQAKAYSIADNKTTDMSEFDYRALGIQLGELQASGIDLGTTGFRPHEIEPLMRAEWRPPSADDSAGADLTRHQVIFSQEQWNEVWELRKRLGVKQQAEDPDAILEVMRRAR